MLEKSLQSGLLRSGPLCAGLIRPKLVPAASEDCRWIDIVNRLWYR